MKTKLSIFLLILTFCQSYAQLQIDAGEDLIICLEEIYPDLPTLGGNPTAIGGEDPYIYIWETQYESLISTYWASSFLDDTTAANPTLVSIVHDSLIFKLTVIDNNGNQAEDSVRLRFSNFYYIDMECISYINKGDTANLFADASSDIVPLTYIWSPNYNISDTTVSSPKAWPDTNFTYTVSVIDAYGCVASPSECHIYVNPLALDPIINTGLESSVFPNPIDESSLLSFENPSDKEIDLKIFDVNGKMIFNDFLRISPFKIGTLIIDKGLYYYTLSSGKKILSKGQIVKK